MMYLNENKKINKLKKFNLSHNKKKFYNLENIFYLIKSIIIKLIFGILYYIWELIYGFKDIVKLFKYKNIFKDKTALILGNGPSQEYITKKDLITFKKKGIIFFVNYWFLNNNIKKIVPHFLVISDIRLLNKESDNFFNSKNKILLKYIRKHISMKIICPIRVKKKLLKVVKDEDRIIAFCDSELRGILSNTLPIFPRGYISMTVYKAIAVANWMNFKKIFILGVDNTYPRNTYSDINNSILNHEIHAGKKFKETTVVNNTSNYRSMADLFQEISFLFRDAFKLNINNNIYNLDEYSLTDAFKKQKFHKGFFKNLK